MSGSLTGFFSKSKQSADTHPTALWGGAAKYYDPITQQIQTGATSLPDVPSEDDLFKQASGRFLESLRPTYAARGLLTSQGAAGEAESKGMQDLATTFGERAFERGMGRSQLSLDTLTRLLATILGQPTSTSGTYKGTEWGMGAKGGV